MSEGDLMAQAETDGTTSESAESRWLDCPEGCGVWMPEWARRAMWEHMDVCHRDTDPETPWVERAAMSTSEDGRSASREG